MRTINAINLRALEIFQVVAAVGSFSEAGRQLAVPRSLISQVIAQLELQLATKLFRRTTRKVALTEQGEALIERITPSLESLRDSLAGIQAQSEITAGTVSLSVSHAFGRHFVVPALHTFRSRHPSIRIDLHLADRLDDLIVKSLDLTIRLGELLDSSMTARLLGSLEVVLVAAPSLVASHGLPRKLDDLKLMPSVGFRVPGSGEIYSWAFERQGKKVVMPPPSMGFACNAIDGVLDFARQGDGVAAVPSFMAAPHLKANRQTLVRLLPQLHLPVIPVHLVFGVHHLMPKRVRLLADHLIETIAPELPRNKLTRPSTV
jgi:LysR family transcriptional regulator, regulator for bpeEF and oprC